MPIYNPSDDSYLIQEVLNHKLISLNKDEKILDMGSGSGILAKTCIDAGFKNIMAADIDPEVISHLKSINIPRINSDLFSKVKGKFDLIVFNPPYLPEDSREPMDSRLQTTAGKKGYEVIIRFLDQSISHLKKQGSILLLFSTLSHPRVILSHAKKLGLRYIKKSEKCLFFEKLFVYELTFG